MFEGISLRPPEAPWAPWEEITFDVSPVLFLIQKWYLAPFLITPRQITCKRNDNISLKNTKVMWWWLFLVCYERVDKKGPSTTFQNGVILNRWKPITWFLLHSVSLVLYNYVVLSSEDWPHTSQEVFAKLVCCHKPLFLLLTVRPSPCKHMIFNLSPKPWLRQKGYLAWEQIYMRETKFKNNQANSWKFHQVMADGNIGEGWWLF